MKTKITLLELGLLVAPFIALAFYWNQIPARIPMHWGLNGQVDSWGNKMPGIFILPLLALAVDGLLHVLPWFDPKLQHRTEEQGRMPSILPWIRIALLALFGALFLVQLLTSLGRDIAGGRILMTCTLLFFVVLGNFLGNVRPNYFVGIRTPWTLENPETWRATHRLGGRLMFFGGLALLFAQLFLSAGVFRWIFLGSILALATWGFVYSWHHCRRYGASS